MLIKTNKNKIKIVPNVEQIAREMTTTSQIGIILKRVKSLSIGSFITLGFNNLPYLLKIVKKDFATGIKVLSELEILILRQSGKSGDIGMHQQMVDMAIALNNRALIKYWLKMSILYSFTPYLYTCNVKPLLKLLSSLGSIPSNLHIVCDTESNNDIREYVERSELKFINK